MSPVGPGTVTFTRYVWKVLVTPTVTVMGPPTSVALAGLLSPSASLYTSSLAVLPRNIGSLAPWLGQKTWMLLSVTGYAPPGGVKRLSHRAAVSVVAVPKPTDVSIEPSSNWKVTGASSGLATLEVSATLPSTG